MAKKCLIEKHRKLEAKWEQLRAEQAKIDELPKEKRAEAQAEFDAKRIKARLFMTRQYKRCALTGRASGVIGYFGVCRQVFREKAHRGELPGVKKSSW
jgi:small subunit ribosomal protein S14